MRFIILCTYIYNMNIPSVLIPAAFVATPVLVAVIMNVVIYARGWNQNSGERNILLPPGPVIGAIWIVLLGLMGFATNLSRADPLVLSAFIVLMVVCLLYPVYTQGLRTNSGDVGNVISLIAGFVTAILATARVPKALFYLIPTLVWASYVNLVNVLARVNE